MEKAPMKRVYYFTSPEYALCNLEHKQLKVSRFNNCNDPYELASFNMRNRCFRKRFKEWRSNMNARYGLLCFCRSWRNPMMWAHYAEDHTGVCYGFDVNPKTFVDVRYVSERLNPNLSPSDFPKDAGKRPSIDQYATKFIHWNYEEEVRLLVEFSEPVPDKQVRFHKFSKDMQLKQVIVGSRSTKKVPEIETAIGNDDVEVFKSRLAFQRFEVVRQKNRKLW